MNVFVSCYEIIIIYYVINYLVYMKVWKGMEKSKGNRKNKNMGKKSKKRFMKIVW